MAILEIIAEQARGFSWVDWTATITALLYVILAARENIWCWFWGIISCSLWAYASWQFYGLWLDAGLQVFYVIMAFIGLYQWKFKVREEEEIKPTTRMSRREHLRVWAVTLPATAVFGYFFANYTPAAATYADAFTTMLSVMATFLLVEKKLENWLYWILADSLYVALYTRQGAYLFALLMVAYVVIAVFGYFNWKRQLDAAS